MLKNFRTYSLSLEFHHAVRAEYFPSYLNEHIPCRKYFDVLHHKLLAQAKKKAQEDFSLSLGYFV